jgi:photosystem II stability/assembly factor-like uncharacterized protein
MTRRWTGLSALLMLVPLIAPAEMPELKHSGASVAGGGRVAASPYENSWTPGPLGDEPGPPTVDVRDFGLVSETEGWVISGSDLYWTASGGRSWQDISPVDRAGSIVLAASFSDARQGWAVTQASEMAGPGDYTLGRTVDGGTTWENIPLHLFPSAAPVAPASAVYLHFFNAGTGWLVIKHASGSNFSVGSLFRTTDGGRTWTPLSIPIGEPVYFVTKEVGWTAGGAAGNELYRTTDGGTTWSSQDVAPRSGPEDQRRFYGLPAFQNEREGLLPVLAAGEPAQVELYAAHDGGARWELVATVPVDPGTTSMEGLPFALIPGAGVALVASGKDRMTTASDRGGITTVFARKDSAGEIVRIAMATPNAGWAIQTSGTCTRAPPGSGLDPHCGSETKLLGTSDGGRTWTTLALPRSGSPAGVSQREPPMLEGRSEVLARMQEPGSRTAVFVGQGFDTCEIPSVAQLGQWIVDSPYRAINLYFGGVGRACSNLALTPSLLYELSSSGWTFVPTWVGLQAPCYPTTRLRMSLDPAVARTQGASEANAAADVAAELELARPDGSGTILYADIEYYDTTNAACHEAVKAFVAGWSGQLHARGSLAGVYATGSPLSTFTTLADVPDAIWPANWVFSSYNPSATVWNVHRLSNDLWSNHQRIRQYTGGHLETWGGVSLNIDCDVVDGVVASIEPPGAAAAVYLPLLVRE